MLYKNALKVTVPSRECLQLLVILLLCWLSWIIGLTNLPVAKIATAVAHQM